MNLGTLTTFCSQFTGDQNQTRYSGLYTSIINEANKQFALDSRCLFADKSWSVVSGTQTYALPSDFIEEKLVLLNGVKLDGITRAELAFYKKADRWDDDTGTPIYFVVDPELARQTLLLYPIPQGADAGTNNLVMTYMAVPSDMVAASDNPLNGTLYLTTYHIAIAQYAAYLLLGTEGATEDILAKRAELLKEYTKKTVEALDRFGNTKSAAMRMRGGRSWR